jgi:nuclear mRNA export protein PCID2/THP1
VLVTALKDGNLKVYEEQLSRSQDFFIGKGTYLIMERLKLTVWRNFVKKL